MKQLKLKLGTTQVGKKTMNFSLSKAIVASRPNPAKRITGYVAEGYGILTTSEEFQKIAQIHILQAQESPVDRTRLWHLSVAEEALNILEILEKP